MQTNRQYVLILFLLLLFFFCFISRAHFCTCTTPRTNMFSQICKNLFTFCVHSFFFTVQIEKHIRWRSLLILIVNNSLHILEMVTLILHGHGHFEKRSTDHRCANNHVLPARFRDDDQ